MMRCDRPYPQGPPIGRPIANIQLYILDEQGEPLPAGCPGELHVGGIGVARGYLHQPDLTAESFVPDPFSSVHGARLYKTGDWTRYLSDGDIEFLGRKDRQIQLRGFRIELNEIEAVLLRHPDIEEAAVVAVPDTSDQQLAAYVVLRKECDLADWQVRHYLRTQLPEYMVPRVILTLDRLPRNISGKVDRAALPPVSSLGLENQPAVQPQSPMARELIRIWANLLKLEPEHVSVHDSFFKLGGHSLLAIQLLFQIKRTFAVELSFVGFFENPTVAGLELAIVEGKLERIEADELDELLTDVENLSDEELDQLLTA
jgi:acyl carrier protein